MPTAASPISRQAPSVAERAVPLPIAAAVTYIQAHLNEKLTVAQLSQRAGMSESAFYQAFKREVGITPIRFVNQQRIVLACRLLRGGDEPVRRVAFRCGFSSAGYFSRVFRRGVGVGPLAFRRRGA